MNKICTKCNTEKPLDDFNKSKTGINGKQSWCKSCKHENHIVNREHRLSIMKDRYNALPEEDKNERRKVFKNYYYSNKERIIKQHKEYVKDNIDKVKEYHKEYRKKHIKHLNHMANLRWRKRRAFKRSVNESYTKEDEQYTLDLFNRSCVNCGSTENLCIDHH